MADKKKERLWNKLVELNDKTSEANNEILDIQDAMRQGKRDLRYTNLLKLKTALDSALLELENQ